ncbi:MAG: tyrosine-type recombinase/integrase [Chloroflexi bacterium]|nr:tyrosine-type recombinase/integrase [Chloroflexota bacterium]
MSKQGGLSYQMVKALQAIFRPGDRGHEDKQHRRYQNVIRSIGTMQSMVADVHGFARFIRRQWPEVSEIEDVEPEMAQALIEELIRRERSGGRIGRVMASLRKLDRACRITGKFHKNAHPLLPYKKKGGLGGFHSEPRPIAYLPEQAEQIIGWILNHDLTSARVLQVMCKTGLRIREAVYLRAQDIEVALCVVTLEGNVNHTKGGRPRQVHISSKEKVFLSEIKAIGEKNPTGHIFHDRSSLPDQVRDQVRRACTTLGIPCLGTHGFRKTLAV